MSPPAFFPAFPKFLAEKLTEDLRESTRLDSSQVNDLLDGLKISLPELMLRLLPQAANYACVPISQYKVGAVAQGSQGLYLGANMEFAGQALNASVHAEQSVVNNAWLHGETTLERLAVSAPPCGHCRQFLNELAAPTLQILLPENDPALPPKTSLNECLPHAFGPENLGMCGGLMNLQDRPLALKEASQDPLVNQALQAAQKSYAPYTQNYAACVLQTTKGQVVAGRYAENAAHNPSLPPLQASLAFLNMNHPLGESWSLQRTILVEVPTPCSQLAVTRSVLSSVAPGVALEYHPAFCL